ncbi:MAG: hypothetical protein HeimC3_30250 [Candidatus Heimdallarchaeota archaeon LC_3]|nr:MAG: hypothetical protein HeimC3_30250 [Candidatus Heimdallarchaeota archaeon LC_3]
MYRATQDLTQEELAINLGVTRQTINSIEREKYSPSLELAFKIAAFFSVKIEEVFIFNDESVDNKVIGNLLSQSTI